MQHILTIFAVSLSDVTWKLFQIQIGAREREREREIEERKEVKIKIS
jgi:hypothetical protein